MRKFLLSAIALMMTATTMLAAGTGDGSSQANAIDFDWGSVYTQDAGNVSWYSVDLSSLELEADDPALSLYLTNLTADQANVSLAVSATVSLPFVGQRTLSDTVVYNVTGDSHEIWSFTTIDAPVLGEVSLSQLQSFGLTELHIQLSSDKQIALSAKVYEREDIKEEACIDAQKLTIGTAQTVDGETWYELNVAEIKSSGKKLDFIVKNNGALDANVTFDLYLDCPASILVKEYTWIIPAAGEKVEDFGRFFLDQLTEDYVYLKLTTDQSLSLEVKDVTLPAPVVLFDPAGAPLLEIAKKYTIDGETILLIDMEDLRAPKGYKTVCRVANPSTTNPVNLKQEIAFATPVTNNNAIVKDLLVPADTVLLIDVANSMVDAIASNKAYLRLTTTEPINLTMEYIERESASSTPTGGNACDKSLMFDWDSTVKQKAIEQHWYEFDIKSIKQNKEQVQLTFTNHSDSMVIVMGSILLDCNSSDTIPYALPIPAGKTISKVMDYSFFAASPLDRIYLSVMMIPTTITSLSDISSIKSADDVLDKISDNMDAEISLTASRASALVDPTLCQTTHQTLEKGMLYEQAAGTTKWYRVTDEFLKNELHLISTFTIENHGPQAANVTLGATVGCDYGITTKFSLPVPKWLDLTTLYPNGVFHLVDKVVNEEVTEFYVEITTDQPIVFGFGLIRPSSLGCDDAQLFDWSTGATLKRFDPNWYKFDIEEVRQSEKHVKLTFTNHSDSIAWVASLITLDCPFYAPVPAVFPVPAGASVDKWIDYSFFAAAPLDAFFVAAFSNAPIELKAEQMSAIIPIPDGCANAQTIEKGVTYTQNAGTTQWYHVPDALLDELGYFPEFTFYNNGPQTAHITMGSTVGCEYGILTKGTIPVPAWFDLTLKLPRWIGEAVDRLVNSDVTEFYVELTTDQPIMFGIDLGLGNMFGCDHAKLFDWNTGVTITPRDAQWHKFDITELKANEMQAKLTFTNTADSIAWVAAFLTYECPFTAGLPMVFPVPAGASVDKWIDYSFIASSPIDEFYLAVYTDSHIRIDAMQETAVITPIVDCENATIVEPNVEYTINPGTSWYKFSAEPFVKTTDTHARLSFANKSGKTAKVTTGATVGCEYGILTRGTIPVPEMDVDVNVPIWVFGILRQFVSDDVHQYYLQVTTDEALNFQIEMEMPDLDTVYVNDTIYEYVCEGTDFTHPITGTTFTVFQDSVLIDTIPTADPLIDTVLVYNVVSVTFPQLMTMELLDSINAVPVLTPGLVPNVDESIEAIKKFYEENDTKRVADVLNVTWDNISNVIDCKATEHKMKLTIEDGCSNIIPLFFTFPVALNATTIPVADSACVSYTWAQTGKTYEASGVYYDTIASQITGCDSIYHELTLTIWPDVVVKETEKDTICFGGSLEWHGMACTEDSTYTYIKKNVLDCDSIIYTLDLTVLPDVVVKDTEKDTICFGGSLEWHGITCTKDSTYTYIEKNALGCDSIIYTLKLTVLPDVVNKTEKDTICYGASLEWHGMTCTKDSTYTYIEKNALGCDSIVYTLDLTVLPDVVVKDTEKHTICYGTSYSWHGIDCTKDSTYTYIEKNALDCDSIIYTLELTILSQVTIPASADVLDGIVVLCGKAIDVTEANATINAHAAADPLFPAVDAIVWEEKKADGTWAPLSNNAIDGTITSVTLRYTLQTACEDITSDPFEINVETPTPENDEDMIDVPAYNRYGNRLLTVDLKYIETNYGWNVVEEDITWYRVNPNGGQDEVVGSSYYLTTEDGNPLEPGSYYARIKHVRVEPSDCDGELKTVIVVIGSANNAPKLVPTVARPQEIINLLNLDPETVSTISIYSTTGELISTFQVENLEQTSFPAAQLTGYYVVEVLTEKEKVSLRYIVK